MKSIPQRTLQNEIARVLREVEAGERLRVTVDGRPVADLVPVAATRRVFVPRSAVQSLLQQAPLDAAFARDTAVATGTRIDEL